MLFSWLQAKYRDVDIPKIIKNHRGFVFEDTTPPKAVMPWGLYMNDAPKVLDWTLPTRFVQTVTRPPLDHEFFINDYIYNILEDMIAADPTFEKRLVDSEGNDLDDRNLLALIIGNYPWSIGSQLRRLVTRDEHMSNFTIVRLEQIVNTYVIASQVLFYIILSQVWGEKRKFDLEENEFPISTHFLDALVTT